MYIFGLIIAVLAGYKAFRWLCGPFWQKMKTIHWRALRRKDVLLSLSAVLIAIVTEYSIPSVGMTGLDYPKEPQRIFYTAQEEWAQKPMTNGQIAQLAPWLGALGEVTKEEYKKRLEQKLSDAIVKISDHEIEIKDHELYIAETKIDTFEQMKKYADARGMKLTPENAARIPARYRTDISDRKWRLGRAHNALDVAMKDKMSVENRIADVDAVFGMKQSLPFYGLEAQALEKELVIKRELKALSEEKYTASSKELYAYNETHPPTKPPTKDIVRDKLITINAAARKEDSIASSLEYQARRSWIKADRFAKNIDPNKAFPVLDWPIEIASQSSPQLRIIGKYMGPNTTSNFGTLNRRFFNAMKNEKRISHEPKKEIRCHVVVAEKDNGPKDVRSCEILMPFPINYDLTAPDCKDQYLSKDQPYRLEQKLSRGRVLTHCIERWVYPHIRIVITEDTITFYEPVSNNASPRSVLQHGSPISRWEISLDGQFEKIDGKITVPWSGKSSQLANIHLRHVPKSWDGKQDYLDKKSTAEITYILNAALLSTADGVTLKHFTSMAASTNNETGGARIWRNFDLYQGKKSRTAFVIGSKYHDKHQFTEKLIRFPIYGTHLSIVKRYVSPAVRAVPTNSVTRTALENRLRDFNQVSYRLHQEASKDASAMDQANRCSFPIGLSRETSMLVRITQQNKLKNLMALVTDNGTGFDCRKYNAIRSVLESLILFYQGEFI